MYDYIVTEFLEKIPGQLSELNNLALELSLLQALARSNAIEINDVELSDEQAIRIARCMRRDLMNARASLVDQWRNIEFVADQLEAQVDLVFTGELGNAGDNPFQLRADNGELSGGFQFDAPIVRLSERNDYREALIDYQQARRNFYQFEDNLNNNLRDVLRNINRSKVLFELDRLTVQVDIQNVEINRFELDAPVSVNAAGADNRLGTVTSRNLTDAIINLNGSQDSFLGSWVDFEVLRRNLDFDLGTMQIDQSGAWIDPGYIDSSIATRAANMMGVQLDDRFCENVDVSYRNIEAEESWVQGDEISEQSVPAEEADEEAVKEVEEAVDEFDYQIDEAQPESKPGPDDELIDPASPLIPRSRLRGTGSGTRGSGTRAVPPSYFKAVKAEATESASMVAAKPRSVIAQRQRLAEQRQKLAPRIPLTTSSAIPRGIKNSSSETDSSQSQGPIVQWESLVAVEDKEKAQSQTWNVAKSVSYATSQKNPEHAKPTNDLIGSSFESSSATIKPITSTSRPETPAGSLTIPAAKQVLATPQRKFLNSGRAVVPLSYTAPKIADPMTTADPMIVIRAISEPAFQTRSSETVRETQQLKPAVKQPSDWKKQSSSLGGLLDRFGAGQSQSR